MRRHGHAVLGGTFDRLHVGHVALLETALRTGRRVSIGVTTDRYLGGHPKPDAGSIQSFRARVRALERWLRERGVAARATVRPLEDRFGGSTGEGVDVLVVSADTEDGGRAVNRERRRLGRRSVPVVVVPLVLADDLRPVSSRRIRAGEIDRKGARRAPLRIGVAAETPRALELALRAVRGAFPAGRTANVHAPRIVGSPARRSVELAGLAARGRDLGLGVAGAGTWVSERAGSLQLPAHRLAGASPSARRRELIRRLAPGRAQRL